MTDIKDTIAELRRLEADATPGPWDSYKRSGDVADVFYTEDLEDGDVPAEINAAENCSHADAALVAAMRNALPALLDEVERLRAHADASYASANRYKRKCDEARRTAVEWNDYYWKINPLTRSPNGTIEAYRKALSGDDPAPGTLDPAAFCGECGAVASETGWVWRRDHREHECQEDSGDSS